MFGKLTKRRFRAFCSFSGTCSKCGDWRALSMVMLMWDMWRSCTLYAVTLVLALEFSIRIRQPGARKRKGNTCSETGFRTCFYPGCSFCCCCYCSLLDLVVISVSTPWRWRRRRRWHSNPTQLSSPCPSILWGYIDDTWTQTLFDLQMGSFGPCSRQ